VCRFAGIGKAALIAANGSAGAFAAGALVTATAACAGGGAFVCGRSAAALALNAIPPAFNPKRIAPTPITAGRSRTSVRDAVCCFGDFMFGLSAHRAQRLMARWTGCYICVLHAVGEAFADRGEKTEFFDQR